MNTLNGVAKIKDKKTGEILTAVYAANRLGNKQYNVNGKFLSDKKFNRLYTIVNDENIYR